MIVASGIMRTDEKASEGCDRLRGTRYGMHRRGSQPAADLLCETVFERSLAAMLLHSSTPSAQSPEL